MPANSVACMESTESPSKQVNSSDEALDDLAAQIVAGAGRLAAVTGAWLSLVADFDACDGAWKSGKA